MNGHVSAGNSDVGSPATDHQAYPHGTPPQAPMTPSTPTTPHSGQPLGGSSQTYGSTPATPDNSRILQPSAILAARPRVVVDTQRSVDPAPRRPPGTAADLASATGSSDIRRRTVSADRGIGHQERHFPMHALQ